jgi:hypothetical protein
MFKNCRQGWSLLYAKGRFLALPANIKLGWKFVKVANTLAYLNYGSKCFTV